MASSVSAGGGGRGGGVETPGGVVTAGNPPSRPSGGGPITDPALLPNQPPDGVVYAPVGVGLVDQGGGVGVSGVVSHEGMFETLCPLKY